MNKSARTAYRPCVGVMLINRTGLVFVGKRLQQRDRQDFPHPWQMPQGGIDEGEEPGAAARRELYEETNVRSARLIAEAPDWYRYDLPSELGGKGKLWLGQTQKWFAFLFEGAESEINVRRPGGGHHPAEFDDWRWAGIDELVDLIVPFKRDVYRQVVNVFEPYCRKLQAGEAV